MAEIKDTTLTIGGLIFPALDQADFTGPFEVLSRISGVTFCVIGKTRSPVRDVKGLLLTPDYDFSDTPALDVLLVPGGQGQEALMDDSVTLQFIREKATSARYLLSVCTGALICGAAGILKGRHATTHWASLHLLPYFGAIAVQSRVVVDGNLITTAGVTAGIDGALRLTALLRGEVAAKSIELSMQYAPEPPFNSGTPVSAGPEITESIRSSMNAISSRRLATAKRIAVQLGVDTSHQAIE